MKGDKKVIEHDVANKTPASDPIATKQEFAYVEPKEGNPRCGSCNSYVVSGGCTIVHGRIDPANGSCNFWANRRTKPSNPFPAIKPYSKEASGYIETVNGPRCGTCRFFKLPNHCSKVLGPVNGERGCCNRWTKK